MVYAQNAAVQEPIFVAKDAGFWAKNGLDVAMTNVTGTAQVPAITSGEAQFANTGAAEVTSGVLNGAPIIMIGTLSDLPIFDLYANKKYTRSTSSPARQLASPPPGPLRTSRRG
jgi:ABC-type nitrate/sulfonate/bicarbonate transport system substrate-binding protein